jgi:hypothetical protein
MHSTCCKTDSQPTCHSEVPWVFQACKFAIMLAEPDGLSPPATAPCAPVRASTSSSHNVQESTGDCDVDALLAVEAPIPAPPPLDAQVWLLATVFVRAAVRGTQSMWLSMDVVHREQHYPDVFAAMDPIIAALRVTPADLPTAFKGEAVGNRPRTLTHMCSELHLLFSALVTENGESRAV